MRVLHYARLLLFGLLALPANAFAQDNPCDQGLRTDKTDPNAYQRRDDRCEGMYVEGQSGNDSLLVASFTEAFEDYRKNIKQPLIIDWTAPSQSRVRLRAYSLEYRRYYRMDAFRRADQSSFSWPISILAALNIRKEQIGIVGWTGYQIGKRNRNLYIPLRLGQQRPALRDKSLELLIVPRLELKEVRVSLALINGDGRTLEVLKTDEKLKGAYYPANRSFPVPIPTLKKPGIYFLSLGAILRKGDPTTTELWFYYGG